MRTHLAILILLSFFSKIAYAQDDSDQKAQTHPDFSIVVIPGNKDQEPDLPEATIEILIARFAGSGLGLTLAGKEIFGLQDDEQIRQCFVTEGCVRSLCVTKQMGRMLYGTIIKETEKQKVKAPQVKARGKKKIKSKKAKTVTKVVESLSIELTLFDAINNRIEMTWVCKKCAEVELYQKTIPEIADKAVEIMGKTPMIWAERMPSLAADQVHLDVHPRDMEVLPPPPENVEAEAAGPQVASGAPQPVVSKPIWPFWTSVACLSAGAGVLGAGRILAYKSNIAWENYDATNVQLEAERFSSDARSYSSTANVMFISGGVLVAIGTSILVLDQFDFFASKQPEQVMIYPTYNGLALNLSF